MSRRRLTLGAAVLGVAVLVAGSGAGAGQARPDGASAPKASEVTGNLVLAHWASSPVETELLQQVVAAFERKYPQIKVRRRALDPYPDAMLAQFAARKPPDVFYVDSNVAPDWIRQGVIEPLDSFINQYKFRTQPFYPRLLSAFRSGGRTYGFPKDWSPLAVQTNNAMLARAGVRPPTNWTQLRSVAQRLRSSNAVPGGRPICLSPAWDRMLAFVYQNNGAFLSPDKKRAVVNSAQNHAAANYYIGLIQGGLAGTPAQLGVGWCGEALGKEKAAIIFEGNWVIPYLAQDFPNLRYTVSPMIRNRSQGNLAFTVSYSIARDSKNKAAAWTLLTYLTGREGMRIWTSKGLALPSRNDVRAVAGRQAFLQAAPFARPWQFAPGFSRVMTVAGSELEATIEGKQSIDTMLSKIQSTAQSTLRRGR
jgi:multiple sugar transport system substrate-binding protein